jgi:hypothetical protein
MRGPPRPVSESTATANEVVPTGDCGAPGSKRRHAQPVRHARARIHSPEVPAVAGIAMVWTLDLVADRGLCA